MSTYTDILEAEYVSTLPVHHVLVLKLRTNSEKHYEIFEVVANLLATVQFRFS